MSTVPGHLLLSITLPPVQHSGCQKPTALTSTHAHTVQTSNTSLSSHVCESFNLGHSGVIRKTMNVEPNCFFLRKLFIWSLVKHYNLNHKTDIFYEFQHNGGFAGELIKWVVCCLWCVGFCSVRTAISFILHTAEDGWLMTSTSGISICPLHRPACVHLLHCSKKHFPFSVVSLTQKTHTRARTDTHTALPNSRPPYLQCRLSQRCKFK